MGKKSRKGVKGKEDKKAQQRQQERRERVIEQIEDDAADDHEDLPASRRAILGRLYVGERVLVYSNKVEDAYAANDCHVHVRRCMVTAEVNEEGKLSVLPINADPSRQDNVEEVSLDRVRKDDLD